LRVTVALQRNFTKCHLHFHKLHRQLPPGQEMSGSYGYRVKA